MRKFRIEAVIECKDEQGRGADCWHRFALELEAESKEDAEEVFNLLYPDAAICVDKGVTEAGCNCDHPEGVHAVHCPLYPTEANILAMKAALARREKAGK